jgi:hypothetical protein
MLVNALAGWAIDHQIGLASKGAAFLPISSKGSRAGEGPEYQRAKRFADQHEHEQMGDALRHSPLPLEGRVVRRSLANILLPLEAGDAIPHTVSAQVREAFDALEYGEDPPLLKPLKKGRKRKLTALRWQLKAISYVEFHHGKGYPKNVASERVAKAFGQQIKTLETWSLRLPKELGVLPVARELGFAWNAGRQVRQGASIKEVHLARYSDERLIEDGRAYLRAQGHTPSEEVAL